MAKISVIVPVYKVEPYLRRCVDSILAQTYRDFELILVDDGSPDRCGEICDEYARQDSRVIVFHQKNGGLSAARNAGIDWAFDHSDSKYITFVDSDDWVLEKYLQELVVGISMAGGVSCCGCQELRDSYFASNISDCEWQVVPTREYWLQLGYTMTAWGKLYEKELFTGIRYPVGKIHEDEYVTHRLLFKSDCIAQTQEMLYCYYRRDDSITTSASLDKRMDRVQGLEDQYTMFVAMADQPLMQMLAKRLIVEYCGVMGSRSVHACEIRRKLRAVLSVSGSRMIELREAYFYAYPIGARVVWPVVRMFDVVKRRGVLGSIRQYLRRFK